MSFLQAAVQVLWTHIERLRIWYTNLFVLLLLFGICLLLLCRPLAAPSPTVYIPEGSSITQTARILAHEHVITSPVVMRIFMHLQGNPSVKSGTYSFTHPMFIWNVLSRIQSGKTNTAAIRITFPEGSTRLQMATLLSQKIPTISVDSFMTNTATDEGYLFPDTYFLNGDESVNAVKKIFHNNYVAHSDWYDEKAKSLISESDAVILASLLEGEANTREDREIVAGILLHRLAIGMRLQVDAPFGYERGISGYVPSSLDIEKNTPYNTYRNKGLPPTPINNPGYDALYAASHPTRTPYLFYLTGSDGKMHYARTFKEHIQNQKDYFN
jgi:UPF0755 protein